MSESTVSPRTALPAMRDDDDDDDTSDTDEPPSVRISAPLRSRADATASNTVAKYYDERDGIRYRPGTLRPQFFEATPDPYRALTHFFDVQRLFGETAYAAIDKKKSLRKLLGTNSEKRLAKIEIAGAQLIAAEADRLAKHLINGQEDFVALVSLLACYRDSGFMEDVYFVAPRLMLDRSVTNHARLRSLRLHENAHYGEIGVANLRLRAHAQALEAGLSQRSVDELVARVIQFSCAYLEKRIISKELLQAALPAAWQLHADTNSPLSERELLEQRQRVAGEMPFIVAGLLYVMGLRNLTERLLDDMIVNVG